MNNFRYALTLANLLYEIDLGNEDDLIEIGLIAYNFIGNKNTRLYRARLDVNENGIVQLPCNCDIIEAVTYDSEDWNYTSNTHINGDIESLYTENFIESQKELVNPLYIGGRFVKYRKSGDKLYVDCSSKVNVLYHGILLDDEGLPEINDKEAIAIADYIAYTYKYKEAIKTSNAALMQIAKDLKQTWLFHCDQARVGEFISQNDMITILDAKTSWNRKVYGKSFKPVM